MFDVYCCGMQCSCTCASEREYAVIHMTPAQANHLELDRKENVRTRVFVHCTSCTNLFHPPIDSRLNVCSGMKHRSASGAVPHGKRKYTKYTPCSCGCARCPLNNQVVHVQIVVYVGRRLRAISIAIFKCIVPERRMKKSCTFLILHTNTHRINANIQRCCCARAPKAAWE